MDARRSETWFFIVLLAVTIFLAWLILAPYVGMLVFAGTLALLFQPLYKKLLRAFRYESLAAFVTIIVATLIIFVPLGFISIRVFGEATALYISLTAHGGFDFGTALTDFLHAHFENIPLSDITFNFSNYIQQGLTWLIQNFGSLFSSVARVFFTAFLSLLGLFYFLKDGERLKKWIIGIVPLSPEYSEEIVREAETVGSSVVKGTLMVAVIQGIVMGAGFFFFGIPDPTLWGTVVVLASLIPIIGTWLVAVPAVLYLFFTGQTALGIGLAFWSVILVNLIYDVLSPQLMHRGANLHPYLILLCVLGGIGLFGPIGFLAGPLIMALLFSLLKIYTKLTLSTK